MAGNLFERFRETALQSPRKIAIQSKKEGIWTDILYEKLLGDVESQAAYLSGLGIKKGDRVAILLENGPEWPILFFAILSIGAIAVPINPEGSPEEIKNILKDSESVVPFTKLNLVNRVVCQGKACAGKSDIACILYTSGTTAEPKGVVLSHGNLISNCDSLFKTRAITEKDSIISILPLHHAYALTGTALLPLLYGMKIIYPGSIRGEDLLEAMRESRPTVFIAVPQIFYSFHQKIYEKIKKMPLVTRLVFGGVMNTLYKIRTLTGANPARYLFAGIHGKFGGSLRLFVSGGARLDSQVELDLIKLGFTILEGYGLTETAPVLTLNPPRKQKIGSVGKPIPGVELEIKGKNEKGIGEVIARGPNITEGYYKKPDSTAEVMKDGWFHTGDLGYIDDEGYLFLTGRSKDMIVLSSGLNIYPEEIEEAYLKGAPIKEMCVFEAESKKRETHADVLWAVVVPDLEYFRKNNEVNLKEVLKWNIENVSKRLPASKRIMGFTITFDNLPRTLLGKIKRYAVKDEYASRMTYEEDFISKPKELTESDAELLERSVTRKTIGYLKKESGVKDVKLDDTLELDLGIDSLGRIELASALEKLFNIKIKNEYLARAFTVRELVAVTESLAAVEGRFSVSPEVVIRDSAGWKSLLEVPPSPESLKKIDLKPGFGARTFNVILGNIFGFIFRVFYNFEAEGIENVPANGPYIIFANHVSYFDGFLIASALPKRARIDLFYVGFKVYFDAPVARSLIKVGRLIPLNFSTHFTEALRSSYYVLKNGKNLCLFPEGLRTFDGRIIGFKRGFGILAKESGAKLLPVYIKGALEAWPRTAAFPKRHPIKLKFGKPLNTEETERKGRAMGASDAYEAICRASREALIELEF